MLCYQRLFKWLQSGYYYLFYYLMAISGYSNAYKVVIVDFIIYFIFLMVISGFAVDRIHENLDPRKFSAIRYFIHFLLLLFFNNRFCTPGHNFCIPDCSCSRGQCSFLNAILIQLLRKCYYLQPKNTVLKPLSNLVQALH